MAPPRARGARRGGGAPRPQPRAPPALALLPLLALLPPARAWHPAGTRADYASIPSTTCFAERGGFSEPLAGAWTVSEAPRPYGRLSCPLEQASHSCGFLGMDARANRTAAMRYCPTDCHLLGWDADDFLKRHEGRQVRRRAPSCQKCTFTALPAAPPPRG